MDLHTVEALVVLAALLALAATAPIYGFDSRDRSPVGRWDRRRGGHAGRGVMALLELDAMELAVRSRLGAVERGAAMAFRLRGEAPRRPSPRRTLGPAFVWLGDRLIGLGEALQAIGRQRPAQPLA